MGAGRGPALPGPLPPAVTVAGSGGGGGGGGGGDSSEPPLRAVGVKHAVGAKPSTELALSPTQIEHGTQRLPEDGVTRHHLLAAQSACVEHVGGACKRRRRDSSSHVFGVMQSIELLMRPGYQSSHAKHIVLHP